MSNINETNKGDSSRITRGYFDSILLEMRHIGAEVPDTRTVLFGHEFSTPVMTAALSHLNGCHPEGMVELARGAFAANAVMWAGMGEEEELERITYTGAKTVKIVKPYADEGLIIQKLKHAEACGCIAVGMDIDHAFNGAGKHDVILGHKMSGKTLEDIKRYAGVTKLPFILKGVLSARDAELCVQAGLGGIVVSHHHGLMDFAVPPLMVLPEIVKTVGGRFPVFLDCCVENGMDVFKSLALGATAVSVGRALMKPLSENGAAGVKEAIESITSQLAGAMARTASQNLKGIDRGVVLCSRT